MKQQPLTSQLRDHMCITVSEHVYHEVLDFYDQAGRPDTEKDVTIWLDVTCDHVNEYCDDMCSYYHSIVSPRHYSMVDTIIWGAAMQALTDACARRGIIVDISEKDES